ncbi:MULTISPECIES: hypothetical protein [Leifsonia]|jgi:hypothetical protein|uniref:Uncharacterized protein n=1 Tax=Leifsonia soli TaxID=582665 RepID=A0A852SX90_9MICO|nr:MULTISPECIES: hypothetical protein [Leifsonia]NYD73325.1 hypothetical protein [Leifsonia soli]SEA85892.1 hypothetical protein SAMN04515680_1863 [Leifsonia sp. 21MFCrub1.1]
MTAVLVTTYRPFTHRVALRVGRALTAWGARPLPHGLGHADRVERIERTRDTAALTLPQLPR